MPPPLPTSSQTLGSVVLSTGGPEQVLVGEAQTMQSLGVG